jgi:hypothetical protein
LKRDRLQGVRRGLGKWRFGGKGGGGSKRDGPRRKQKRESGWVRENGRGKRNSGSHARVTSQGE